jgi:hypothetical protein
MKTMQTKNMPNYQKNDSGHGFSVKVDYPTPQEAKVKHTVNQDNMVNFMGLGQFSDWL